METNISDCIFLRFNKKLLVISLLILFATNAFALASSVSGFSFGSSYGAYSEATVTGGTSNSAGSDASLSATASLSGSDTYGDTNSASSTASAAAHSIQGNGAYNCVSSIVCYDIGHAGYYNGVAGDSYGDTYDTYTVSCTGTCPGIDLD